MKIIKRSGAEVDYDLDKIKNAIMKANDTVKITGESYTKSTVGNDVVLNVGTGSIKLVGAKGKSFNIQGTEAAEISANNNVSSYDLIASDNNFISNGLQLDSILPVTDSDYSSGKIDTSSALNLTQQNSLITAGSYNKK